MSEPSAIPPGLCQWVKDWIIVRRSGNVKLTKQIKRNIDSEISRLGLDSDVVFFVHGDPDAPGRSAD